MAPFGSPSILLVLGTPLAQSAAHLGGILPKIKSKFANLKQIYVHVIPPLAEESLPPRGHLAGAAKKMYGAGAAHPELDLRLLFHGWKPAMRSEPKIGPLSPNLQVFCSPESSRIPDYLQLWHQKPPAFEMLESIEADSVSEMCEEDNRTFDHVVIGGTFDHLHSGHKILLVESVLRAKKSLTIGVTENDMLKSKILRELIAPCQERIRVLRDFLEDCDPSLEYKLEPISDPFGPSIVDPDLKLIVGSDESAKGCEKVNTKRLENGLNPVEIVLVQLEADPAQETDLEEAKVSSSSMRMRRLGTLLKPPMSPWDPQRPYVIGLTGGSASGKSSISKRLEKLGAKIVDCDKLGHKAYEKGTECLRKVVEAFGEDVLDQDGNINRRSLGAKVFGNLENKTKLENVVWPEIRKMAENEIKEHFGNGCKVIVLDAAVLLTADWHGQLCNEVWVSFINRDEAVKRIVERDGRTEAEAVKRLDSQMSNTEYINHAQVVFCTEWAGDYTQKQVEKAWGRLVRQTAARP